jgi:putative hydrolase of the HAD superfamily
MPLADRKVLTFDVVGTLIDFETGILDYVQGKSKSTSAQAILEAYAIAEDRQHHETPRLPFPSMMSPMYHEMAACQMRRKMCKVFGSPFHAGPPSLTPSRH